MARPAFHVRGIPVYVPLSAGIGFGLISWLALPAAEKLVGSSYLSVLVALCHGFMLYLAIFIHELGHALTAQKLGYEAQEIVVHLFGGHTAFKKAFQRPLHLGLVGFMGPAMNLVLGVVAFIIARFVGDPILASLLAWFVWSTFAMALLNLLPGIPLDGGSVLQALVWAKTKSLVKGQRIAAYGGFAVAIFWAALPWILNSVWGWEVTSLDVFFSIFIAYWLSSAAAMQLRQTRQPQSESVPSADQPIVPFIRKSIAVNPAASCEEAIRSAAEAEAGAILISKDGQVIGVVREAALNAVPQHVRAQTAISTVARRITDADKILVSATLLELASELSSLHVQEWLVVDADGASVGVLQKSDLPKAERDNVGV